MLGLNKLLWWWLFILDIKTKTLGGGVQTFNYILYSSAPCCLILLVARKMYVWKWGFTTQANKTVCVVHLVAVHTSSSTSNKGGKVRGFVEKIVFAIISLTPTLITCAVALDSCCSCDVVIFPNYKGSTFSNLRDNSCLLKLDLWSIQSIFVKRYLERLWFFELDEFHSWLSSCWYAVIGIH